ncbi:MAG TPA: transcription-repair coupling factor [Candidatus Limnocylindria bacterium]|jgi:transcription-repair coupling factor (superfamily II helicase)|nr:transcription-repair coupling factor [Candidatus Limnocylindria bacterium]
MAEIKGGVAPLEPPKLNDARLGGILALAERSERYRELASRLADRESVSVADATAGARAFAWSALVANGGRTVALVAPSEDRARRWRAELAGWLGEERVLAFPERETMPFEVSAPSGTAVHQRLLSLWRLATAQTPVAVVTSLRALLEHTIPPDELARRGRTLRAGDRLSWQETASWLFDLGYEPVTEVSEPGTFSRRGGIIDIYPASADQPARVELFGDEIETLRAFDPVTQRSQSPQDQLVVLPAREFSMENAPELAERLAEAGWDRAARADDEEAADLSLYARLVDSLREGGYAPGADAFAPALGATASLLDHLGDRGTVVFEDTVELDLAHDALEAQAEEKRGELAGQGLPVSVFPPPYVPRSRVDALAQRHGAVRVRPAPDAVRLGWSGLTSYAGRLDQFLREIAGAGRGTRIVATPQAARLAELLADREIPAVAQETVDDPPGAGALVVARVPLAEGFAIPELDLRVFTDAEVFGFRKPRHPEQRRRRAHIGSFLADLKPGDHVVHEDHGIARFERFVTREVAGVVREYLELRFAGTDVVALPTERVDKVTRYVGGTPPGLSTLGGRDWVATKRKAKKAAEEIARELLRLYAAREATQGFAFGRDTPWQIEMENAFPYTETPDQLQAIEDTKRDMERGRPMDRLIVGDVGYGKTEVALRAAFKAVQDGKQVAIVVPTTVLAQQHYETFAERLATFPVNVEMLSRFRSPVEQRAVAAALGTGEVDIVVGTHRVLQKDVQFRDIGLVVIDEEHRFGVKHKERLKQMRTEVDVLSMTATPIPRTLHMALSGVRDISVIETPPENRQPIETHVVERSDDVLREAIVREVDRGGQVYYVHNRVQGIEQEAHRLRQLVPTARYIVAHGQMDERKLERVMVEFADAEHDVLVCTTIIESGLDIPNVNTIVINRAGTLGLAQLYQLRGRVGRSAEKAYAYLLYTKEQHLTEQARKRLQAVFEASELGAGFKIAMHDLEIRGAGNILGAEQHGHVTAVGFELYTQLLEEAVNEQRGAPRAAVLPEITVDLALSTAIPDDYVPSRQRKLELYRRIAELATLDDLGGLREELRDRYGPPPEPVRNLLYGVEVKLRAAKAGATEVRARGAELRVVLGHDIQPAERERLARSFPRAQAGQRQIRLSVLDAKGDWRDALTGLLDRLAA